MNRKFLVLLFIFSVIKSHGQIYQVDSLQRLLSFTNEDTTKVMVLARLSFYDQSFEHGLQLAEEGLMLAKKIGYKKGEAQCLHQIGNQFQSASMFNLSLHYFIEALKIYDQIDDKKGISRSSAGIGTVYEAMQDYQLALTYYSRSVQLNKELKDDYFLALGYNNVGTVYFDMGRYDSALYYYQRSYEHFTVSPEKYQLIKALNGLGDVQLKMGNDEMALSYYRLGLANGSIYNDSTNLPHTYLGIAQVYQKNGDMDSVIKYAHRALFLGQAAKEEKITISAGRLLSDLFKNKDDKEALRYLRLVMDAKDSIYSSQRILEIQKLTYQEQERKKEIAETEQKEIESRKHNLQYAGMVIGLIAFIILFFILSRSIIAGPKFIEFLAILGLLAVFEFINLFIHPYLARLTNDSPIFMLLILIAIGALLIPLHHRLEKWITRIMVAKNKKIRLKAAKKTIAELDND